MFVRSHQQQTTDDSSRVRQMRASPLSSMRMTMKTKTKMMMVMMRGRYLSSSSLSFMKDHRVRQSFGSFHSENVDELVRLSESSYQRPTSYQEIQDQLQEKLAPWRYPAEPLRFGSSLLSSSPSTALFSIDPSWTFINHGAFGGTLSPILLENSLWRQRIEQQPLKFFDRELFPLIVYSLREMSKIISCPTEELFPIVNVTTGINLILHSLFLQPDDEIVYFNVTYGSTKKILSSFHHSWPKTKLIQVNLPFPIQSTQEILDHYQKYLSSKTKLVIIDHITSNTALEMPIAQLAKLTKKISPESIVMVDAAHSLFSQEVSLYSKKPGEGEQLADVVDCWLTNGHKWFSSGKGAALLWISPRMQQIRPLVVSHGFTPATAAPSTSSTSHVFADRKKLLSSLIWDGCRDYVSFLSLPSVKLLWDSLPLNIPASPGGNDWQVYRHYMRGLLEEVENLLVREWSLDEQTDFLSAKELRQNCPMRLIPLPRDLFGKDEPVNDQLAFQFQEYLHHQHRIEVPVKCLDGRLFLRISAHIYNELRDYQRLAQVIRGLLQQSRR